MKAIKPGQFWVYQGALLRAMRRTSGCHGCIFKDCLICPDCIVKNSNAERPNCEINDIILVKV